MSHIHNPAMTTEKTIPCPDCGDSGEILLLTNIVRCETCNPRESLEDFLQGRKNPCMETPLEPMGVFKKMRWGITRQEAQKLTSSMMGTPPLVQFLGDKSCCKTNTKLEEGRRGQKAVTNNAYTAMGKTCDELRSEFGALQREEGCS